MTKKTKKIAILEGGISSEREVSLSTGKACFKTFQKLGYNVKSIDTKDNFIQKSLRYSENIN